MIGVQKQQLMEILRWLIKLWGNKKWLWFIIIVIWISLANWKMWQVGLMHNNYLRQLNSRVLVVSESYPNYPNFGFWKLYSLWRNEFLNGNLLKGISSFLTLVSTTTCWETWRKYYNEIIAQKFAQQMKKSFFPCW